METIANTGERGSSPQLEGKCDHAVVRLVLDQQSLFDLVQGENLVEILRYECRSCEQILTLAEVLHPVEVKVLRQDRPKGGIL